MLISAPELAGLLATDAVAVIDCRFDLADPDAGQRSWREACIPGAAYAHLDRDLSDLSRPDCGRHPLPDGEAIATWSDGVGIRLDRPVVVYDDGGGLIALRAWWLLRHAGHPDVRLLDGGFTAWQAAGCSLARGGTANGTAPQRWGWGHMPVIGTDELAAALRDDDVLLVDARAPERFRGELEPLDRVAGHIPGAVNRPLTRNLDAGGCFREPAALRDEWALLLDGRNPADVVHSCGSGVTACHNLFSMTLAGLAGSRLYWPSWSGWISDPLRPVAVGAAGTGAA